MLKGESLMLGLVLATAAVLLLVGVTVLGFAGFVLLPFAFVFLLITPLLDVAGGLLALNFADSVALLAAAGLTLFLLFAAPDFVFLNTLLAVAAFLVVSVFVVGIVATGAITRAVGKVDGMV